MRPHPCAEYGADAEDEGTSGRVLRQSKEARLARAFAHVLGKGGVAKIAKVPVLAASKSVVKRKRDEEAEEEAVAKARLLKLEMRRRGHVVGAGETLQTLHVPHAVDSLPASASNPFVHELRAH